jgi:MFS_1 like family
MRSSRPQELPSAQLCRLICWYASCYAAPITRARSLLGWPVRINRPIAYIVLYVALYAAFGVASPFGQSFFETRALTCQQIGLILGAAMLVRLAAGPLVGMLADFLGSLRLVFATCAVLAAGTAAALLLANSFRLPFFIVLVQAAAFAPTTSIADALSVNAAKPQSNLNPGWCVVHICHSRDAKYSPDCDRRPVRPGANRKVRVDLGDCPEKRLARCKGLSGELPPSHGNERIGQP